MPEKKVLLVRTRRGLLVFALSLALALLAVDRYAAYLHRPAEDATRVVIYTTTWCPYCKKLREDLAASKVPHTEYDVEKSMQGALGMWALHGRGVPVSAIGSKVVYGYRVDQIAPALATLGYVYLPAPQAAPGPPDQPGE